MSFHLVRAFFLATCVLTPSLLHAAQSNQFGGQDRADAAARMIVLAVQQGISALPPASGQGVTYEFDPEADTYERSLDYSTDQGKLAAQDRGVAGMRLEASPAAMSDTRCYVELRSRYGLFARIRLRRESSNHASTKPG